MKLLTYVPRWSFLSKCRRKAVKEVAFKTCTRCFSSFSSSFTSQRDPTVTQTSLGLHSPMSEWDTELYHLLGLETDRQKSSLELIASENFVSPSVLHCLGSLLTNKYAEGRPGKRYYGGVGVVDKVELLAERRALEAFHLSPEEWNVNVQPYSGSPANMAVYMAVLLSSANSDVSSRVTSSVSLASSQDAGDYTASSKPLLPLQLGSSNEKRIVTGTLMGLHLSCGGHLTHGFFTPTRKVSASSLFFHSVPYFTDPRTGYVEYDGMRKLALEHYPDLIIAGGSAYPRDWEYNRFRAVCDELNREREVGLEKAVHEKIEIEQQKRRRKTLFMVDIAHTAGLIAANEQNNPFLYADIVTTTTHKTLRGPRAGMIFARKISLDDSPDSMRSASSADCEKGGREKSSAKKKRNSEWLPDLIHRAVFPGLQGGPHLNQIAAIATQLKAVCSPEWREYAKEVKASAQYLAMALQAKGEKLVTKGTDNHLLLWDLRPHLLCSCQASPETAMESSRGELSAAIVEECFDAVNISVNRNTVPGDGAKPSGIRLGTAALTTRGVTGKEDWTYVAELLLRGLELSKTLLPPSSLSKVRKQSHRRKSYRLWLNAQPDVQMLKTEVIRFASSFPLPGEKK